MEAVTEIFQKIGDFLAGVNWEEVFNTVKGVVEKIIELVSSLAA